MKRIARDGLGLEPSQAMRLEADAAARRILGRDTAEGLAAFQAPQTELRMSGTGVFRNPHLANRTSP